SWPRATARRTPPQRWTRSPRLPRKSSSKYCKPSQTGHAPVSDARPCGFLGQRNGGINMLQMIQHMIAGILASATIIGGGGVTITTTDVITPPGSVDPQNPPGLA